MPRPTSPLFGRESELSLALDVVRGATEGLAAALVIGGDAGVGKTRLLAELTAAAGDEGMRCLIGHCVDLGDTPPPYLPFAEAFRRYAAEAPEGTADLVALYPTLARLLRGRAGDAGVDDRVERGELFDSVRGALAHLAGLAPVALFIEDVHWADQATRDLLGYLFTRIDGDRVVIVVSYRSDDLHRRHPLRRTLAEWARLPVVTRVHLDPLRDVDVADLLRAARTDFLTDADIAGIVRRAEGNAFFAEELLAAAAQYDGTDHLPWQLADLLLVRLDRLSEDARQVVRVAAVAGRRVSHEMLAAVVSLPAAQLDDALREAVDSHVLQLTSSGRGYVFRHALLAEAVYDDLLPGERVRVHAGYATALAADSRLRDRDAELARHARASHDLATAFEASVRAGEEAMSLAAPQEALQQFEAALELLPQLSETSVDKPTLTLAAVDAAEGAGHGLRGVKLATAALAELPPDATPLARATLLFALVKAAVAGEVGEEAFGQIAEALQLVPEQPPTDFRAQVLAMYARVAYYLGREVEAVRSAGEAIEVADLVGRDDVGTDARTTLALVERRSGDPGEAARLLDEVAEQARSAGDTASELRSRYSLAMLWYEQCQLDRAEAAFVAAQSRAAETGRPWENFGMMSRSMTATIRYLRGEWDAALATIDTTDERPTPVGGAVFGATHMIIAAGRGEPAVLAHLDDLRPHFRRDGWIPLYGCFAALSVYEMSGDAASALAMIDEVVEILGVLWLDEWFLGRIQLSARGLAVLSAAATTAPRARQVELAADGERLLREGRTSADRGLPRSRQMGPEGMAWLARLEAESYRLRWLTGQDAPAAEELVAAWERAVAAFDYGNLVECTRSRVRLAAALRATGRAAEAGEVAQVARTAALSMGAAPMLAELAAVHTSPGPRRAHAEGSQPGSGLGALTDRERDVLTELIDGRTNRQIATKLFISEKTVSVHVSNILAKLGVRSRAEAAAHARRDSAPT